MKFKNWGIDKIIIYLLNIITNSEEDKMKVEFIHKKVVNNVVVLTVFVFENSNRVLVSFPDGKEYMCSKPEARKIWKETSWK